MNVYAIDLQPSLAITLCSGRTPISIGRRPEPPPRDLVGKRVMIAARGKIIGCARLAGAVTLKGDFEPALEHPSAVEVRWFLRHKSDLFGPRLWVFDDGVMFKRPVKVEAGLRGALWYVPAMLHDALGEAQRTALAQLCG